MTLIKKTVLIVRINLCSALYQNYPLITDARKLKNFTIIGYPKEQEIYNDGQKPQHQQKYKNITFKIQVNDSNAYNRIRIGIPGPHLTLCEVQIFGGNAIPPYKCCILSYL